jgi:hypothetical protein
MSGGDPVAMREANEAAEVAKGIRKELNGGPTPLAFIGSSLRTGEHAVVSGLVA